MFLIKIDREHISLPIKSLELAREYVEMSKTYFRHAGCKEYSIIEKTDTKCILIEGGEL